MPWPIVDTRRSEEQGCVREERKEGGRQKKSGTGVSGNRGNARFGAMGKPRPYN